MFWCVNINIVSCLGEDLTRVTEALVYALEHETFSTKVEVGRKALNGILSILNIRDEKNAVIWRGRSRSILNKMILPVTRYMRHSSADLRHRTWKILRILVLDMTLIDVKIRYKIKNELLKSHDKTETTLSRMEEMQLWGLSIKLLRVDLPTQKSLINKLLELPSKCFVVKSPAVRIATFENYRFLADVFSATNGWSAKSSQLKLFMIPILNCLKKEAAMNVRHACIECWRCVLSVAALDFMHLSNGEAKTVWCTLLISDVVNVVGQRNGEDILQEKESVRIEETISSLLSIPSLGSRRYNNNDNHSASQGSNHSGNRDHELFSMENTIPEDALQDSAASVLTTRTLENVLNDNNCMIISSIVGKELSSMIPIFAGLQAIRDQLEKSRPSSLAIHWLEVSQMWWECTVELYLKRLDFEQQDAVLDSHLQNILAYIINVDHTTKKTVSYPYTMRMTLLFRLVQLLKTNVGIGQDLKCILKAINGVKEQSAKVAMYTNVSLALGSVMLTLLSEKNDKMDMEELKMCLENILNLEVDDALGVKGQLEHLSSAYLPNATSSGYALCKMVWYTSIDLPVERTRDENDMKKPNTLEKDKVVLETATSPDNETTMIISPDLPRPVFRSASAGAILKHQEAMAMPSLSTEHFEEPSLLGDSIEMSPCLVPRLPVSVPVLNLRPLNEGSKRKLDELTSNPKERESETPYSIKSICRKSSPSRSVPFYPSLADSKEPISSLKAHFPASAMVLFPHFRIKTIGDLCRKTRLEIAQLSLRSPERSVLAALNEFAGRKDRILEMKSPKRLVSSKSTPLSRRSTPSRKQNRPGSRLNKLLSNSADKSKSALSKLTGNSFKPKSLQQTFDQIECISNSAEKRKRIEISSDLGTPKLADRVSFCLPKGNVTRIIRPGEDSQRSQSTIDDIVCHENTMAALSNHVERASSIARNLLETEGCDGVDLKALQVLNEKLGTISNTLWEVAGRLSTKQS